MVSVFWYCCLGPTFGIPKESRAMSDANGFAKR